MSKLINKILMKIEPDLSWFMIKVFSVMFIVLGTVFILGENYAIGGVVFELGVICRLALAYIQLIERINEIEIKIDVGD